MVTLGPVHVEMFSFGCMSYAVCADGNLGKRFNLAKPIRLMRKLACYFETLIVDDL